MLLLRKQQFDAWAARTGTQDFAALPALLCEVDDFDVLCVHLEKPAGRVFGTPGLAVAALLRLPEHKRLAEFSDAELSACIDRARQSVPYLPSTYALVLSSVSTGSEMEARGFLFRDGEQTEQQVVFIPSAEEVFSRTRGILETGLIGAKKVCLIGVGSGGSAIAVELAKCGVGHFHLIDFDRLELGNVCRHQCGVPDLGRFKTRAVRDLLLDKNPHVRVTTSEIDVLANPELTADAIGWADVVIAGTDNNKSRFLINETCIRLKKVAFYGRMRERAYGGDVLRARPNEGPCYACILEHVLRNQPEEYSNPRQSEQIPAYARRQAVPEPGLSNDIAPVATMIVKLALQELVRGTGSALEPLDQDLEADYYFWINRRQAQELSWKPMRYNFDRLSILRWYGARVARNPDCSACGTAKSHVTAEEEDFFKTE